LLSSSQEVRLFETVAVYEPCVAGPFERTRCRVLPGAEGLITVDVLGWLEPGWLQGFATGLYPLGVSLKEAYAREDLPGRWSARLHLEPPAGETAAAQTIASLDALLHGPAPGSSVPAPRLLDFSLVRGGEHGALLHLEVHAWEARGLLAGVLVETERVGLVPVELLLETEGECAFHQLVLRGPMGAPSPDCVRQLAKELSAHVGG
jgi:hypothetical protein